MADAGTCAVCLEYLVEPVSIPCGHLHCRDCLSDHIETTTNPHQSTCPTCRTPFSLVTPDVNALPRRFSQFITPTVRRVYLDTASLATQAKEHTSMSQQIEELSRQVDDLSCQSENLLEKVKVLRHGATRHAKDMRTVQNHHLAITVELDRELKSERALSKRLQEDLARERRCADSEYEELRALELRLQKAKQLAEDASERESSMSWMLEEKELALERLQRELREEREANKRNCARWKAHCDDLEEGHRERERVYDDGLETLRAELEKRNAAPCKDIGAVQPSAQKEMHALRRTLSHVLQSALNTPDSSPARPSKVGNEESPDHRKIRPLPRRAVFGDSRGTIRREREDEVADPALSKRSRVSWSNIPAVREDGTLPAIEPNSLRASLKASLASSRET